MIWIEPVAGSGYICCPAAMLARLCRLVSPQMADDDSQQNSHAFDNDDADCLCGALCRVVQFVGRVPMLPLPLQRNRPLDDDNCCC